MRDTILILEDDPKRLDRFMSALSRDWPLFAVKHWSSARTMIEQIRERLPNVALISLDHDLYVIDAGAPDPSDGLEVAKHLATIAPCCPVIIHSSNSDRARMMQGELDLACWVCRRVLPLGEDWIESSWIGVVGSLLHVAEIEP